MKPESRDAQPNKRGGCVRHGSARRPSSEQALRDALRALLHERPFDGITVQQVARRAEVGRTTFYAHFQDKGDLLLASFTGMLDSMTERLQHDPPTARRLLPVREFFAHVAEAEAVRRSLAGTAAWPTLMELARAHFARTVEAVASSPQRAHFVAGAMIELLHWWLATSPRPAPAAVDAEFHAMARAALRAPVG